MFHALPLIAPRDTHSLWHVSAQTLPHASENGHTSQAQQQQQQQHHRSKSHVSGPPSALQQLELDEQRHLRRKENVRRFGSTWLRPPGVSKTLQAMYDEAAERAEQEALARREAALAEQQAAAGAAQGQPIAFAFGTDGEGARVADDMERDLDDAIPDADAAPFADEDEENEGEGEDPTDSDDDGGFDDDDQIPAGEHDLDDDIPDAGSYQHTDTDVEDEDTDESSPVIQGTMVVQDFSQPLAAMAVHPEDENHQAESSMLESSPSVPRGGLQRPVAVAALARSIQRGHLTHGPPSQPDFGRH